MSSCSEHNEFTNCCFTTCCKKYSSCNLHLWTRHRMFGIGRRVKSARGSLIKAPTKSSTLPTLSRGPQDLTGVHAIIIACRQGMACIINIHVMYCRHSSHTEYQHTMTNIQFSFFTASC